MTIELTHVRIPLVEPFRISSGAVSEKDAIVVRIEADGLAGWGESSPMAGSFYSADTPESCWQELCEAIPTGSVDGIGNFAKGGVETALWDLDAQRQGLPLYKLLGGTRSSIESGLAVGLYGETGAMLRAIERHLKDGYKRVKIKIEPGHDVELVRAVRSAFGGIPLFVDANGAYRLEHLPVFRELDDYGLMMFEQPFAGPMLEEMAELQRAVRTPVCLDESLETERDLRRAIELGCFRIANIKIQRVGGLGPALRLYEICRQHAIPVWVGTMPELGIGAAQAVALAALEGCTYPTDVEASLRWFTDDLVQPLLSVHHGYIQLPEAPGLGYAVDERKVERYAIRSRSFGTNLPLTGIL